MTIKFHKAGFENAIKLIHAGEVASFDADWDEERPTTDEMVNFINTHYMNEYGLWFLGTDSQFPDDAKEHYCYPYGDLKVVQKCALEDTIKHSQKDGNHEITRGAKQLLEMIAKKQ